MALCLSVEGVDEAPEHALALIGELCSIGHDGLVDAGDGLVPEDAVVGFVGTGGCAMGPGPKRPLPDGHGQPRSPRKQSLYACPQTRT